MPLQSKNRAKRGVTGNDHDIDEPPSKYHKTNTTGLNIHDKQMKDDGNTPLSPNHLIKVLQRKFAVFKDELDVDEATDELFAKGIISSRYEEKIREARSRRLKTDIFVKAIVASKEIANENTIFEVRQAIVNAKHDAGALLKDFFEDSDKTSALEEEHTSLTEEEIRDRLEVHKGILKDNVEAMHIIDDLVVTGVLNFNEHDDILNTVFMRTRMKVLLRYIRRNPKKNFPYFCRALCSQTVYRHFGELISKEERAQLMS